MTDLTPGRTMARQNAEQLRGGGSTTWRGPAFRNPVFSQPEPFEFPHDGGVVCGNCNSGSTRRFSPTQRECIRCHAVWVTAAQTAEELAIEKFRAVEAAKK